MMEQGYAAVQDLFSQMAEKFGTSVAIDNGRRRLTYLELDDKVERLRLTLASAGVSRGSFVGIFAADPVEVVAGILATLKCGGIFFPLDPAFPEKRLQTMFETVSPSLCVTQPQFEPKLRRVTASLTSAPQVVLPDDSPGEPSHPLEPSDPEAPCSVYFTSGSTGKPKAILGRLKGIDHYVRWEGKALGVGPGTRVSQLASPAFDGFLKDVFVPLCAGGAVCAPESRDVVLDAGRLIDWLDIEQIEVLHCVPSLFRSLLNEGLNDRYFEAMKYVVLAGEALPPADVKRWMDVFGERIKLINLYGPTETTILKLFHFVQPEDVTRSSIPLGKPIPGAAVLVVDRYGQPCGAGDVGEIYIRTPYRAHGYYAEPEMTREVFIKNPFSSDPADIVYRTGDYGRFTEDGNVEFLGRQDQQVKVRGVRVELGEIENLLHSHDAVADVAVVDRDDAEGNKFLVAYVTMNNGDGTENLRQYLAERLPEAMLPSAFVQLEQLPRTLNGKIDRKALPSLVSVQAERAIVEESPRGPVEEIVAGIWQEVLKVPKVARSENFFNLGGHSLLVTQVILRVREILKVELPIRSLFEAPTIAQFSDLIQQQITAGQQNKLTAIEPLSREGDLPLSFSQQRMWFLDQISHGTNAFYFPLGLRLKGALNAVALEQTFGEIIRRHENLRTIFPAVDAKPVQVIQPATSFKLPLVDLSRLSVEERELHAAGLAQEETLRRFDLAKGPLVRTTLLRLSETEHILICTMHHIISDGQSFGVLIAEMARLYNTFLKGQPSPLPELKVQYADYAAWERRWLQGDVLDRRLRYWRNQLEKAPRSLSLPQRQVRPQLQGFNGARQELKLSASLTDELRQLSRREGVTLLMTMLSGFVLLLNRFTGDEDVVVGTVSANRERSEAEKLIGILANTLVLRVDVSGELTFKDLVKRVRDVCLDAYSYQVPPELLREDFNSRGANADRLFDVWFQLERANRETLEMEGLACEPYNVGKEAPRFEMSMVFVEGEDEIEGILEYDVDLFDDEIMAEMVQQYSVILEQAVSDPDRAIVTEGVLS